jgi:hypothetical protein
MQLFILKDKKKTLIFRLEVVMTTRIPQTGTPSEQITVVLEKRERRCPHRHKKLFFIFVTKKDKKLKLIP